ncbi:helix-turn-helix domain-containing protein [Actinokineospora sp.]|uniref:helix-turn-helix domain-containing protein n=1 Tax=Actinokineospora sp. TaxID=1872133 RepID=UPI003D6B7906
MSERLPARMRALGNELTTMRERAGLTTRQAAARLGVSIATLNRTENARRVATVAEVSAMLAIYGVIGPDRKRTMGLVEDLDAPHWLAVRFPVDRPALPIFEDAALSIVNFAPSYVPGLLQTRGYARRVLSFGDASEDEVTVRLDQRIKRQSVLTKLAAPAYTAIIDEAVLRRSCGSPELMVEQLRWLMDMAKLPNISIHVIPFRHGLYRNPGYFSKLEFAKEPPIVYVEHEGASGFLHEQEDTDEFHGLTDMLAKLALSSADSVNFLTMTAADYERS